MMFSKCPKCGYDPSIDLEAEKKQKAQNKRDGKFTLKEIVEATKKINPQIWTDQNK